MENVTAGRKIAAPLVIVIGMVLLLSGAVFMYNRVTATNGGSYALQPLVIGVPGDTRPTSEEVAYAQARAAEGGFIAYVWCSMRRRSLNITVTPGVSTAKPV